jgi:hypothetical protein
MLSDTAPRIVATQDTWIDKSIQYKHQDDLAKRIK